MIRSWILVVVLMGMSADLAVGQNAAYMTFADARSIFEALRGDLWPRELQGKTPAQVEEAWPAWVSERDKAIRARVASGDEDSLTFLLLFGTSFTKAPRATARELSALVTSPAEALKALQPRLVDFVAALAAPGTNERLQFAREVVVRAGLDPSNERGRTQVRRYLEERTLAIGTAGAGQLAAMLDAPGQTGTIFRERGLSSDTTLTIDFGIERALQDLESDGVMRSGAIRRVAIVGPGLDFVDKQNGYDFYPQQTIQPFALVDSLLRVGLASLDALEVVAFDLSPRVIQHLAMARQRAQAGAAYPLVLPRNLDQSWSPDLVEYWERVGNFVEEPRSGATPKSSVAPPPTAGRVGVRSVSVRPSVVLATTPGDLNIVLQRTRPASAAEQFDLIVATNILLYYDVFEQSLAASNVAAMLRPGGIFLTNQRIVELPGTALSAVGSTDVIYMSLPGVGDSGDRIMWYQKP